MSRCETHEPEKGILGAVTSGTEIRWTQKGTRSANDLKFCAFCASLRPKFKMAKIGTVPVFPCDTAGV